MSETFPNDQDYIISSKTSLGSIEADYIIILTVFKDNIPKISQHFTDRRILQQDSYIPHPEVIVATPMHFAENIKQYNINTRHIIVHEPDLIEELDFLPVIAQLRAQGFFFVAYASNASYFRFLNNPEILSYSIKYFIRCTDNEDFYVLFFIFKYCILDGSTALITSLPHKFGTMQIFLQAIHHEVDLFLHEDGDFVVNTERERIPIESQFYNNVIMVGSNVVDFNCDRIIYLSSDSLNIKEEVFDFEKISKYRYRINDLLRSITPNVLNGKKKFDYSRFTALRKEV